MERLCAREQQHEPRKEGNSENRLPSMTSGQNNRKPNQPPRRPKSWFESCARPRCWIDGPDAAMGFLVQKYLNGRWCRVASASRAQRFRCHGDVSGPSAAPDHASFPKIRHERMSGLNPSRNCWRSTQKCDLKSQLRHCLLAHSPLRPSGLGS